jgi:hypothetical protein
MVAVMAELELGDVLEHAATAPAPAPSQTTDEPLLYVNSTMLNCTGCNAKSEEAEHPEPIQANCTVTGMFTPEALEGTAIPTLGTVAVYAPLAKENDLVMPLTVTDAIVPVAGLLPTAWKVISLIVAPPTLLVALTLNVAIPIGDDEPIGFPVTNCCVKDVEVVIPELAIAAAPE